MEKIKIFACSEASEGFTKEICDYLKKKYNKNMFNNYISMQQ